MVGFLSQNYITPHNNLVNMIVLLEYFPTSISICIWNKLYASFDLKNVINMSLFKNLIKVWSWFILNCNNISNYSHMYQEDGRNVKPAFRSEVLIVEAGSILFIMHHYCRFRTFSFGSIKFPPTLHSKCVLVTKAR